METAENKLPKIFFYQMTDRLPLIKMNGGYQTAQQYS